MKKLKSKLRYYLGLLFTFLGILLLVAATGILVPLSTITFGPISASGLSQQTVTKLFIGLVLLVIGLSLLFPDLKKLF